MGKGLDKDNRKRLERLSENWDESVSAWGLKEISAADLRLLLEHFEPLRNLIRTIATSPAGEATLTKEQQITALRERLTEEENKCRVASDDLSRMQSRFSETRARCSALENDLTKCSATAKQLLQANEKLEKQLQQSQKELDTCRAELKRFGNTPAELRLLRSDLELAQRLELSDLPVDDTRALIRVVAVLAQRDNIERLWDALKERCENRRASEAELGLLKAALDWCNHNWRNHPYRFIEVEPHTSYNFECHLRCKQTLSGEKISEQRLPGIADSSGKPLRKVLVSTI